MGAGADACRETYRFLSLENARAKIKGQAARIQRVCPHTSLGWLTPVAYAVAAAKIAAEQTPEYHPRLRRATAGYLKLPLTLSNAGLNGPVTV